MPSVDAWDQLELMTKVARLYHEQGETQSEIGRRLHLSQAKVSRLLTRAKAEGIVRTTVVPPSGVHVELEEALQERFALLDAVVVTEAPAGGDATSDLGRRAASYLRATLGGPGSLGVSPWSATLLAAAEAMGSTTGPFARVVQLIGGHGDPATQARSMRLLTLLAEAAEAVPIGLPAPGTLATPAARAALMSDASIVQVVRQWQDLSVALVGIGSVHPSAMLRESGNAWDADSSRSLKRAGAIGDICLRFFDEEGTPVASDFDERVVGIDLATFRAIPRRIAVAGGESKTGAIKAALLGQWINIVVTDAATARRLIS